MSDYDPLEDNPAAWEIRDKEGAVIFGWHPYKRAINPELHWQFQPDRPPQTRRERLRWWWYDHRPHFHLGPCEDA